MKNVKYEREKCLMTQAKKIVAQAKKVEKEVYYKRGNGYQKRVFSDGVYFIGEGTVATTENVLLYTPLRLDLSCATKDSYLAQYSVQRMSKALKELSPKLATTIPDSKELNRVMRERKQGLDDIRELIYSVGVNKNCYPVEQMLYIERALGPCFSVSLGMRGKLAFLIAQNSFGDKVVITPMNPKSFELRADLEIKSGFYSLKEVKALNTPIKGRPFSSWSDDKLNDYMKLFQDFIFAYKAENKEKEQLMKEIYKELADEHTDRFDPTPKKEKLKEKKTEKPRAEKPKESAPTGLKHRRLLTTRKNLTL